MNPSTPLVLGLNTKTVTGTPFDRTVKFQFSSASIEFDYLDVNGVESDCIETAPVYVYNCEGNCT